jgi:hypothetical protein
MLGSFGAIEVRLTRLIACVYVVTMSHQYEMHLPFIDVSRYRDQIIGQTMRTSGACKHQCRLTSNASFVTNVEGELEDFTEHTHINPVHAAT